MNHAAIKAQPQHTAACQALVDHRQATLIVILSQIPNISTFAQLAELIGYFHEWVGSDWCTPRSPGCRRRQGGDVTVPTTNNQLLRSILERRHPEYCERVEDSSAVDIHMLMENLNVGRQRVAVENAERDAEQKAPERQAF
jgi:hypothetical protein